MCLVAKIAKYANDFGMLGLAGNAVHRICRYPKTLVAFPPKLNAPLRLRFETNDFMVFNEVIVKEQYAFGLPVSPKVIVDAGANIGMTSLFYATKFPDATIFAIEPEPSNFEMLRKNVRRYPKIMALHAALWRSEGQVSVTDPPPGAFGHFGFAVSADAGDIRAITIPSLMRDFGLSYIDLVKVDIEGSETAVFESCDWQDKIGSVVIELHDRLKPGCSEVVNCALNNFSRSSSGELTRYQNPSQLQNFLK